MARGLLLGSSMRPPQGPPPARVLLVESDDDMRSLLTDYLSDAGLDVEAASDVGSALERARGQRPRVVISDLATPGRSRELQERMDDALLPPPPVIVLEGIDRQGPGPPGAPAPAAVMQKPFRLADLLQAIRRVIGEAADEGPSGAGRWSIPHGA